MSLLVNLELDSFRRAVFLFLFFCFTLFFFVRFKDYSLLIRTMRLRIFFFSGNSYTGISISLVNGRGYLRSVQVAAGINSRENGSQALLAIFETRNDCYSG